MKNNLINDNVILDVALKEFGTRGFELASTNVIAEQAQISKGTIFKRFATKKELYNAIFEREFIKMSNGLLNLFETISSQDSFAKIGTILAWKAHYAQQNPLASSLMLEAVTNYSHHFSDEILQLLGKLKPLSIDRVFDNLDFSVYLPSYQKDEVLLNLTIALNGLQGTYVSTNITSEKLAGLKDKCIDFLKITLKGMEANNGKSI